MFGASSLPRTRAAVLRDLAAADGRARASAVRDAVRWLEDDREVLRAVEKAASDESPEVRIAALQTLADGVIDPEASPSVLSVLLVAVEDEAPVARQWALTALGELGDPRATERLRRALTDVRADVRFQAVVAFARVCRSFDDALEALLAATRDRDAQVVERAVLALDELCARQATPLPEQAVARARELLRAGSPSLRTAAAIALGHDRRADGAKTLVEAASGRHGLDRELETAALDLCGDLGLTEALPALQRRARRWLFELRDPLWWQVRVALARLGDASARDRIGRDVSSRDDERAALAMAAAARVGLTSARADIEKLRGRLEPQAVDDALLALEASQAEGQRAPLPPRHPR